MMFSIAINQRCSPSYRRTTVILAIVILLLLARNANALVLTNYFEAILVKNVSTAWTTVTLDNTYSNAVPVCTYVLGTFAGTAPNYTNLPAAVRIRNIAANSFQVRIQGWENSAASTANVHCIVMDEGAHKLPDGRLVEAHTVVSDKTNGQFSTDGKWLLSLQEDVSSTVVHSYKNPAVVAQVISYEDSRASVPFLTDCDLRTNHPFMDNQADGICIGKHIGMIPDTRLPETMGYIIGESGSGTVNNVFYELKLGADAVAGNNGANAGYTYPTLKHHNIAVLTQGGEDGGNGSWAVLYGSNPFSSNAMTLVVDEEIFAGDVTRNHTREHVFYWAFAGAEITLVKKVINDNGGSASTNDFQLTATGPDTISGVTGDASITKAVVQPGTYLLSETTIPGYTAGNWSCTGATAFSGTKMILQGGDHVTCTIVNDDIKVVPVTTLTLEKDLTNNNGGSAGVNDFTLTFSGPGGTTSGVMGDASITSAVIAAGSYTLTESIVPGYQLQAIKCDGADTDASDGLDIKPGEKVTCVFVNDDLGVDLNIAKSVDNSAPNIGSTITFTLLVSNIGPNTATDIHVFDQVPNGFIYQSNTMTGGDAQDDSSPTSGGLDWTINNLGVGSTVSLSFQATVSAP